MKIELKEYHIEIDEIRGILYIHSVRLAVTSVRISGLNGSIQPTEVQHRRSSDLRIDQVDISLIDIGKILISNKYIEG